MSQADDYSITLDANVRPYEQSMGQATSATQGFTAALVAAGQQMDSMIKRADRRLNFITAANVAGLTAAGVAAAQLDQQMSQLQARTELNTRQTGSYVTQVNNLRRGFGMTSADAITLTTQLNRMNVSLQAQGRTAGEYAKLSAVTGENITGLAQAQQQFMRSMGGNNQNQIQRYSSMVATLNQSYGAGAQATLEFANNIAPLSKSMGMTTQQIAGISAAFSKAGADGGAAANAYTKILSDINRAVQYGSPELQSYSDVLGTTVERFKEMPAAERITQIFETLNQQGPQAIKTLERFGLEGVRNQRAIASVMSQGGLRQGIAEAGKGWSDTGPFNQASQKAMDGFLDNMSKAGQQMQTFAQGVGSTFLPAMGKLAEGTNAVLSPLGALGNFMMQMPTWAKNVGAFALAVGALAPLLPKMIVGLASASVIPGVMQGSLGQGFRLGRTPGRDLSPAQRTYMEGGGSRLYRGMFGAAMTAGDLFNRGGRGRLEDLDFRNRAGEERGVVSSRSRLRDMSVGGLISAGILPRDYETRQQARQESWLRRGARTVGMGAAGLALEQLRPVTPNYLMNSARSSEGGLPLTGWGGSGQERGALPAIRRFRESIGDAARRQVVGVAGTIADIARQPYRRFMEGTQGDLDTQSRNRFQQSRVGMTFTPEGVRSNIQDVKDHSAALKEAASGIKYDSAGMRQSFRDSAKAMGTVTREAGRTAAAMGRTGVGVAGGLAGQAGGAVAGGVGAAGRGIAGLASAVGPLGFILGGAAAAGYVGSQWADTTSRIRGVRGSGEDESAGASYRDALGEAAQSTRTFAEVMAESTGKIATAASTVEQAIDVSQADIDAAKGRKIVDETVRTGSEASVQQYAQQVLRTASPAAAEQLKADVTARFGGRADAILSQAYEQRGDLASPFRMVGAGQRDQFGPFRNDIWLSEENRNRATQLTGTLMENVATAQRIGGNRGAARVQQSQLAGFGRATAEAGRGEEGRSAFGFGPTASPEANARAEAMMESFGISKDDKKSREGFTQALNEFSRRQFEVSGKSGAERDAALDQIWVEARRNNLSGTALGAQILTAERQGGVVTTPMANPLADQNLGELSNFESQMRIDRLRASGVAGQLITDTTYDPTGKSTSGYVTRALGNEANTSLQYQAQRATAEGTLAQFGGDYDQAIKSVMDMGSAAGAAGDKQRELAAATEALLVAERDFARQMGGQTNLNDRLGQASADFGAAQRTFAANPDDPLNAERLNKAREANKQAMLAANEYIQGLALQFRALDHQREQGLEQIDRTQTRQLRDFNIQAGYAQEDFDRSRAISQRNFNLQRGRAEDDFAKQRSRQEYDYALQRSRSVSDFNRQRERAEDDFQRSLNRQMRDRDIGLRRQREDFNRSRRRDEADFNTQVKRMAEDSAKSVYDIYQRVNVARTWSAGNLLENMRDQQTRLAEQQQNLAAVRKQGLSDDAISQLGLSDSQNAQQLQRMMQDFQSDPTLVAQYNKMVKARTAESSKLMRDASNSSFQRMEEDRKRQLRRQDEDFALSVNRARDDFSRSVTDARADFRRAQTRNEADFRRGLARSNADFRRAARQQNEDFKEQMVRSQTDFTTSMNEAGEQFDILRARQRENMKQGWIDMREDFDYQMDIQERNISFFAEQTAKSFDEAYKTVASRTQGETKKQVTAMRSLMDTLEREVKADIKSMDTEIRKPYDQWNVKPAARPVTPARGPNSTLGGDVKGGPNDTVSGAQALADAKGGGTGGPGDGKIWPLSSHRVGTPWGRRGGWSGSATLGRGFHSGADFPAPSGSPIHAVMGGTVASARGAGAYGNMTVINHGNGVQTWYAHQSMMKVGRGDKVNAGQHIGNVGTTGRSTGPHLHLELRVNGMDRNPVPWLKGAANSTAGGAPSSGPAQQSAPTPNFANMKSVKKFEDLVEKLGYFMVTPKAYHSGLRFKRGDLPKGIAAHWAKNAPTIDAPGAAGADPGPIPNITGPSAGKPKNASWGFLHDRSNAATKRTGIHIGTKFGIQTIGGYYATNSGYHRFGQALDVMTGTNRPALRRSIAEYAKKNYDALNIIQVIEADRIFTEQRKKEGWRFANQNHFDHVHLSIRPFRPGADGGYQRGTRSAQPGWSWVGEGGPELMHLRGGEQVIDHRNAMVAAKAGQTVSPKTTTNNYAYDHSVTVEHVTVEANDPTAMLAKLESQARMAALTSPRRN